LTALVYKFKEVIQSVSPILILVLLLHFFFTPLSNIQLLKFLIGSLFVIVGLAVFLIGVDLGVSPFGNRLGESIAKSKKFKIVILAGLLLGFFVSMAEPDLHILAVEISSVTSGQIGRWLLVGVVSAGISLLLTFGMIRILYSIPLFKILTGLYAVVLILSIIVKPEYLAIAFDSSGATTGTMAVPFILALSLGIARMKKNGKSSEKDSFGLVAIASTGAIIAVLLMSIFTGSIPRAAETAIEQSSSGTGVFAPFLDELIHEAFNITVAVAPLFIILMLSQFGFLELKRRNFMRMARGFYFAWLGLVIFMSGVNAGFMDVGRAIGAGLAGRDNTVLLVVVGFVLGLVCILTEPAVHVLTHQIEDVTSGSIRRSSVLIALTIGVGSAVALSMLRILIPALQLWHILLPGYIAAVILANTGSKLFVGIAFDSGGVASGPMTATFILAYTQGAANVTDSANMLIDGFGVISLVALTPIITLQVLGLIYRRKTLKREGVTADG
jgi:hypothetical protein